MPHSKACCGLSVLILRRGLSEEILQAYAKIILPVLPSSLPCTTLERKEDDTLGRISYSHASNRSMTEFKQLPLAVLDTQIRSSSCNHMDAAS